MERRDATAAIALTVPTALIGRAAERAAMEAALKAARAGDAGTVVVQGEAGVGKSRLIDECAHSAELEGFQVLRGRCIEGGGIPYLPLTSALLPQLRRASMLNRRVLGTGDVILASLVGEPAPGSATLTSTDHSRLAQALSRAIIALAERRPLILAIDDLQWADDDSLVAIEYLAFAIADEARRRPCNAVVVLSGRTTGSGKVAKLLDRVGADTGVKKVTLHPFNEIETHDLVRAALGRSCAPALLGQILDAGSGNALLTLAILEEMARTDALFSKGNVVEGTLPVAEISVATAIQAASDRDLRAQSPSRRLLLSELALLGADSALDDLVVASGRDQAEVLDDVSALIADGLLMRDGTQVRLVGSALVRAAAEAVPVHRRQQLHAEMGMRLYGAHGLAPTHLLALGRQLLLAGDLVRPEVSVPVLEAAACRAQDLYAFGASAELYQAALDRMPADRPPTPDAAVRRGEIHFECGRAFSRNGDYPRARAHYLAAADLFQANGRPDLWGEALAGWGRQFTVLGEPISDTRCFEEYLGAVDDSEPGARAMMLAVWADSLWNERNNGDLEMASRAASLAARARHDLAGASANATLGNVRLRRTDPVGALAAFRECSRFATRLQSPTAKAWGPVRAALANLILGNLEDAATDARAGEECARSGNDWSQVAMALAVRVSVAALRGEFDHAETMASEASMALGRSGYRPVSALLFPTLAWMRAVRGRWDGADDAIEAWASWGAGGTAGLLRDAIAAFRDPADGATRYEIHRSRPPWRRGLDTQAIGPIGALTILGRESGEGVPRDFPFDWLEQAQAAGCAFSTSPPLSLGRILGIALGQSGHADAGTESFQRAAEVAERNGARAELALIKADRGIAGLSIAGDASTALLRQAVSEFEELGMWGAKQALVRAGAATGVSLPQQPGGPGYPDRLDEDDMGILEAFAMGRDAAETASSLLLDRNTVSRRRTALLARLGIESPADAITYLENHGLEPRKRRRASELQEARAGHIFLFTDIDSSTPLTNALGDERYVRLLALHDRIIEEVVLSTGGNVVKHTGDGYFVEFGDADGAIACALAIQKRFPVTLPECPNESMAVGIGLHAGGAVARGFDYFGTAVIMAARICGLAAGGEVLASGEVRAAATPGRSVFVDRGRFALKGFDEQVRVYAVGPPQSPD